MVNAIPRPPKGQNKLVVTPPPRLGLASIQAAAFEGKGSTDAAWAVSVETPDSDERTILASGIFRGKRRTRPASVGDEYGREAKRGALVDAFAAVLSARSSIKVDTLAVHCADNQVVEELNNLLGHTPSLSVRNSQDFADDFYGTDVWGLSQAAYSAAADLARVETRSNPLRGASDGSLHPFQRGAGAGWVLSDGRAGCAKVDTTEVLVAELRGLKELLSTLEKHQAVIVEMDSREALRVAGDIIKDGAANATRNLSGMVTVLGKELEEAARGLDVELMWVRGHNGAKFNEAADRIALNACRSHRGLNEYDVVRVIKNVGEEIVRDSLVKD